LEDHRFNTNSQLWKSLCWINELFGNLTRLCMAVQCLDESGSDQCGILTASVIKTIGSLTVCCLSQKTNTVYAGIRTEHVHPDCERWAMSNINGSNIQTYTEYPIPA
jgi:hypothetical protein